MFGESKEEIEEENRRIDKVVKEFNEMLAIAKEAGKPLCEENTLKHWVYTRCALTIADEGSNTGVELKSDLDIRYSEWLREREKYTYYNPNSYNGDDNYLTYLKFEQAFGYDLANEAFKAYKNKEHYSAELLASLRKLKTKDGKPSVDKPIQGKFDTKTTGKAETYWIPTYFKLLNNEEFLHLFGSMYVLFLLVARYIVRGEHPGDKADLLNKYYKKGKLASIMSIREMAERLDKSPATIISYIKILKEKGIIHIDTLKKSESWDKQKHSIYVLGYINNTVEHFYIDEVFNGK